MQKGISGAVVGQPVLETNLWMVIFSIEFQGIILITDENFASCGQCKIQNF